VQNLTSYSCLATPISYKGVEISSLSRLVIEIPFWAIWGFFAVWGYLATSGAKFDVIFLFSDSNFYSRGDEISRVFRVVFEIPRGTDRQTDDRCGDRNRRLSHCKCASLISWNVTIHYAALVLQRVIDDCRNKATVSFRRNIVSDEAD